ncbi:MAG TPA: YdcF family protein [Alphaproteobacteria bacterium]|nr:YdcF family protein [Alphaproteobacteria bacterium]
MRRPKRRGKSPARWLVPFAVAAALAWLGGLVWFAQDAAGMTPPDDRRTDAIVVLTGGSERLSTGLRLLARDKADKLFVSGVYAGVEVAELLRLSRRAPGELECCIVLGYAAGDTRGNALETAAWVRDEGYSTLRLVTSNYHMARSLLEFRQVLPDIGIVPHPVHPDNVHLDDWWRWPGTASLVVSEYNKFLVTACRYWISLGLGLF